MSLVIKSQDLTQLITNPTRVDSNSATTIDLCFTNLKYIRLAGVMEQTLSDHLPTFVLKKKLKRAKIKKEFKGRDYKCLNSDQIRENLSLLIPDTIEEGIEPDIIWNRVQESCVRVADSICPIKTFLIKDDKPTYLVGNIGEEMVLRNKLFHRARLKPRNEALWLLAKHQKYKVRTLI